ncbi:hypothetical protein FOL47_004604 [Perkinsus chesapeaki]|uniref:Uncharacterized protein n=1 Tax=Perkinsus chesapeaki TaxID=330153 RepID=A0A7J6M1U3_PERCH|nr:hypothetical protein FOL47_004604 [Perkinsus chesapeaki]
MPSTSDSVQSASMGWGQQLKRWFNLNFILPARSLQKIDLASAVLLGLWFGIFPIPGTSTALLGAFLVIFRRSRWTKWCPNAPQSTIAFGVNLLCTPLCIALIPAWLRIGGLVSPPRFVGCHPDSIVSAIKASDGLLAVLRALQTFASCIGLCIIVYLAFTPAAPGCRFWDRNLENESSLAEFGCDSFKIFFENILFDFQFGRVQRRQEAAAARAEFEALKNEKTLVKIRWEHKPGKMLWVSSNCFKDHVLSTPERPAFYLGPMPGFFNGDIMQVVQSVSVHPGLHPTLRPNKLLPPPKVKVLPCIDDGQQKVQYPLLPATEVEHDNNDVALRNRKEDQVRQDSPSDEALAYAFRQKLRGITADGLEVLAGRMQDRSDLPPVLWRVLARYVGRRCPELPLPTLDYLLATDMSLYCEDWHLIRSGLEVHLREFARCPESEFGLAGHLLLLKMLHRVPRKVAAGLALPLGNFLARAVPLMDSRTLGEACRLLLPLSRYGVAEGWWNAAAVKMASLGPTEATVTKIQGLLETGELSKSSRKFLGEMLRDSVSLESREDPLLSALAEPPALAPPAPSDPIEPADSGAEPVSDDLLVRSPRAARQAELLCSTLPKYPVYPLSSTPILWHLSPAHCSRAVFDLTAHKLALVIRSAAADSCGLAFRQRHRGLPGRLTDRAKAEDFAGLLATAACSRVDRFSHRDLCIVIQALGSFYRTRLLSEAEVRSVLEPALSRLMTNDAVKRTLPVDLARVVSGVKYLPDSPWRSGIIAGLERHTVYLFSLPYTVPLREAIPSSALVSYCVSWSSMRGDGRALRLLANHLPKRKADLGAGEWTRCVQALAKGRRLRMRRRLERRLTRVQ